MNGLAWIVVALLPLLGACAGAPVHVKRVSTEAAYQQVEGNVLLSGKLSSDTKSLLHRYDLARHTDDDPVKALMDLHERSLQTNERSLLYALAELSYLAGERSSKKPDTAAPLKPRDFYLGAAVYAYLYLFGEGDDRPSPFDRRFRFACDLYNYGLGRALIDRSHPETSVNVASGRRSLPMGELEVQLKIPDPEFHLEQFERFLLADDYQTSGLSVRNRTPGLGAPLICVGHIEKSLRMQRSTPATVFLRLPSQSLRELASEGRPATLELYSAYNSKEITVAGQTVPLEKDLTVARAYTLDQTLGLRGDRIQFFFPTTALPGQVILTEPYRPGRIPVVLVHGTFSSPVPWGEMLNTLYADPMVRERYQIWLYLYSSSIPMVFAAEEFRDNLKKTVQKVDPQGRDPALQQMVIVGHSQGGLLAKMISTDSGDQLWRVFSDKSFDDIKMSEKKRDALRRYIFLKPLPFVRRVVFISTPHRGSYRAGGFLRRIIRRFVALPMTVTQTTTEILTDTEGIKVGEFFKIVRPTSVDGMSPRNPMLQALAEIPVAPGIKAHSIIPVRGDGDYTKGSDGIVKYESAHVDYVQSELVVRGWHSCQHLPTTVEEVRRILHEHIAEQTSVGR